MARAKILLGADPEFELTRRSSWKYDPARALESFYDSGEPFDECNDKRIGVDGAGEAVEFRPYPGIDSKWLVINTKRLFKRFKARFKGYGLSVAGNCTPLGAHIHFGVALDGKHFAPFTLGEHCAHMFDYAIGEYLMNRSGKSREDSGYKSLSDCRPNEHGFEYRTPAAILFAKPAYVELVGRLLKAILEYYLRCRSTIDRVSKEKLHKIVDKIKAAVLTPRDQDTLADLEEYRPSLRDNVIKYWEV